MPVVTTLTRGCRRNPRHLQRNGTDASRRHQSRGLTLPVTQVLSEIRFQASLYGLWPRLREIDSAVRKVSGTSASICPSVIRADGPTTESAAITVPVKAKTGAAMPRT